MNKLLATLLCCSDESRDDSHDKFTQSSNSGQRSRSNQNLKPKNQQTYNSASKSNDDQVRKINKKDLLDDEHSVNETDTITNTNDESNHTPVSQSHAGPVEQKDIIANQESPDQPQDIPNISEEKLIYSENEQVDKAELAQKHTDSQVEQQQDIADDSEVGDDESVLDLTKMQEGQAFNPESGWLLNFKDEKRFGNKKCLILDLDETLVHSSFKYLRTADFVIPVEIDGQVHHVYVIKRPGVDEFLKKVGTWFEVVVFTASVSKYGDPLLDKLDITNSIHHRLFRDSCYNYQGNFIKNLSQVGRPLSDSIIIDNSPASYIFHPQHSIPISSWFSDTHDNELLDLLPFLEDIAKPNVDDVGKVLDITI